MKLTVQRLRKTEDGIFGIMTIDTNPFSCFTVENLAKAIPAGTYTVDFTWSTRFQKTMPHIIVPSRDEAAGGDAGIRIHSANYPKQLEGCIAVGDSEEDDAVNDSQMTFRNLMGIIMGRQDLSIEVKGITENA